MLIFKILIVLLAITLFLFVSILCYASGYLKTPEDRTKEDLEQMEYLTNYLKKKKGA